MEHKTITANYITTISWFDGAIIDWVNAGRQYAMDGTNVERYIGTFSYSFDGAITSANGEYAFIYQQLAIVSKETIEVFTP